MNHPYLASILRIVLLVVFSSNVSAAPKADRRNSWPMWRGPAGNGISSADKAPLHWSPTQNIAWKTLIPGVGYSSPIVTGNTIFVTSANVETKERILFCVDRTVGDIRWQRVVATAEIEQMHRENSPASATPATDGELVFVCFQVNETLFVAAYDFEGEQAWHSTLGEFKSRHGFHTCPVLFEDSIIISGMQDSDDAFLARLHRRSGDVKWRARIDSPIRSFSSPLLIEFNDQFQAVLSGANRTYAFDAKDGRPIWQVTGPAEKTVSSLSFDGEHVFVPGGRDSKLFAIRPDGKGDVTRSHITWIARRGIPYISSPVLVGDTLHVVNDEGVYTRIDRATGQTKSQKRLAFDTSSSPIAVRDHIYVTDERGQTKVLDATNGKVVAENSIGEPVFATPAFLDGEIIIRGTLHLFCIREMARSSPINAPVALDRQE